jgi:hypothetical protein
MLEPYKTNKSSLSKFLDKKEKKTTVKNTRRSPHSKYERMLCREYDNASPEDKLRLEAVGFNPALVEVLKNDHKRHMTYSHIYSIYLDLRSSDRERSEDWYSFLTGTSSGSRYYVAGKDYGTKERFMLSLTGLGKELL